MKKSWNWNKKVTVTEKKVLLTIVGYGFFTLILGFLVGFQMGRYFELTELVSNL